jgi:hypothetical protein
MLPHVVIEVDFRQSPHKCPHGNYVSAFDVWNQISLQGSLESGLFYMN